MIDVQPTGDIDGGPVLARRLVEVLGGRFSTEMGVDVDRGGPEIERWLLAAALFGTRISADIAVRTYRVMAGAGVDRLADVETRSTAELVELLDRGGYARYDYRTATRLRALAAAVRSWGVVLPRGSLEQTRAALDGLPGWGPVTVSLFLRELRGVWPGIDPPLDDRAADAGRHLGLLGDGDPLEQVRVVAARAGLDLRDVEASLIRLWLAHHRGFAGCPGGTGCAVLAGTVAAGQRCATTR